MNIIIVGCGKVGYTLVEQLGGENHNITVIDTNEEKVNSITDDLDAMGIVGNGVSFQTLSEAGIDHADLLIAVTGSDEQNLLCCVIAKKAGHCKTIARVRNPIYNNEIAFLREELGLAMIINPELSSAAEIARIFQFPSAVKIDTFSKGRIELLHFRVTHDCLLNNYELIHIRTTLKCDVLVCMVTRGDQVLIPRGDFVFREGDVVAIVSTPPKANDFFKKIGIGAGRARTAMIVGGGTIAYYLARRLLEVGARNRKQWKRVLTDATGWNNPKNCELWRSEWAGMCNRHLSIDNQIDHRSYERQGKLKIPTIHEGADARKIEEKYLTGQIWNGSWKVEENQMIKKQNALLQKVITTFGKVSGALSMWKEWLNDIRRKQRSNSHDGSNDYTDRGTAEYHGRDASGNTGKGREADVLSGEGRTIAVLKYNVLYGAFLKRNKAHIHVPDRSVCIGAFIPITEHHLFRLSGCL